MLLYKYKGASELLHLLDIAVHERLFCQEYSLLNDPFEGQFRSITHYTNIANFAHGNFNPYPLRHPGRVNYHNVGELLVPGGTKVCSLSATSTDVRMWSLYAESHFGVAIEIDFTDAENRVRRVEYVDDLPKLGMTILAGATPEQVLSYKTTHWAYEQEYRIIGPDKYYEIDGRIRRVIVGLRARDDFVLLLKKVMHPRVTIAKAKLDHEGVAIQVDEVLHEGVPD
ncbi:DUF2971 domain-containing protein [Lysobacter sp. CFH 32150]|uniref:DUF2971 domain-containing protein n=1 Tax=Lysobacter sp. CFH 32150 TaxID=2927128 RepID=UPI001FA702A9|nr:DUF2971 domain-containing protein [Lysobacter sp. CFH 32150]MCI4568522.1 DUF2971 domain-containing protein [Lysobacter sp. CFH 32150]